MNTESPNTKKPDETKTEPLSCSSADLPDLQSGSSSDDEPNQKAKYDNPFTVLREIPSPKSNTTYQLRSKCPKKKKNRKSMKAGKQPTTTNDSTLSREPFGDQDYVLLDKASARNTLSKACASEFSALQTEALISLLEIQESTQRSTIQKQSSPVVGLEGGERILRESILSDAEHFIANAHAQTYINHHREVLKKSSTAYAQLLLLQFEKI